MDDLEFIKRKKGQVLIFDGHQYHKLRIQGVPKLNVKRVPGIVPTHTSSKKSKKKNLRLVVKGTS